MYNVWHLFILCFLLPSKWCQMHVVAHENLTLESIMDSIIAPDFWLSGVKSYSAAKLWCSWYCKLEGLIISTLKNYRRDNHCWDSNLAQSLHVLFQNRMSACGSEPHSSSAVWQYMLKIDASFGERKNGIRTQDLLNTSQTLLAPLSPPLDSTQKSRSKSVYTEQHSFYIYCLQVKIPCRQHSAWVDTLTTHHHSLWQHYLPTHCRPLYNRHQVLVNA